MTRAISLKATWTLGARIGGGGFGEVFRAVDDQGNSAAVKLVRKRPGAGREILIAAGVAGIANVIAIIDSGEDLGDYVLVMPLAERSLEDEMRMRGGPFDVAESVKILGDASAALAGVSDRSIVHRDVKPANLLLLDGSWHISDFGIARYAEATTEAVTFKFSGSSPYVAPERWRGARATSASDVYSFGVMAYEMLTGRRPFSGPDYADQHQHHDIPPLSSVPPKLASLVLESLDKAPEARPTAANIVVRLRTVLAPASPGAAALRAANLSFVEERSGVSAKQAAARTEEERRGHLLTAAGKRLEAVALSLQDAIAEAAPQVSATSAGTANPGWSRSLGSATLFMDAVVPADSISYGEWRPAFDIVAYSTIGVRIPSDRHGYAGRSHSLWYCDATEAGVYRWFETAFMLNPLMPSLWNVAPMALPPGADAAQALGPWMGTHQVAWPFLSIDQGDEGDFMERWMNWFARAAVGDLGRPASLPERSDAQGSWRT